MAWLTPVLGKPSAGRSRPLPGPGPAARPPRDPTWARGGRGGRVPPSRLHTAVTTVTAEVTAHIVTQSRAGPGRPRVRQVRRPAGPARECHPIDVPKVQTPADACAPARTRAAFAAESPSSHLRPRHLHSDHLHHQSIEGLIEFSVVSQRAKHWPSIRALMSFIENE